MASVSKPAFWAIILTVAVCSGVAIFTGYFLRRKRFVTVMKLLRNLVGVPTLKLEKIDY